MFLDSLSRIVVNEPKSLAVLSTNRLTWRLYASVPGRDQSEFVTTANPRPARKPSLARGAGGRPVGSPTEGSGRVAAAELLVGEQDLVEIVGDPDRVVAKIAQPRSIGVVGIDQQRNHLGDGQVDRRLGFPRRGFGTEHFKATWLHIHAFVDFRASCGCR